MPPRRDFLFALPSATALAFNFLRPISTGNHNSSRDTAIDHWIPVLPRLTDKNEVNTMRRELRRQSGCRVAHLPWSVSSAKHIFHENFIERRERETKRRAATLLVHAHVDRGACTRGRLDRSITRSSEPRDVVWLYQTMLQISRRVSPVFVCARASESAAGGTDASRCTPTMPVASSSLRDGPFYVLRIYNGNFRSGKRHSSHRTHNLCIRASFARIRTLLDEVFYYKISTETGWTNVGSSAAF